MTVIDKKQVKAEISYLELRLNALKQLLKTYLPENEEEFSLKGEDLLSSISIGSQFTIPTLIKDSGKSKTFILSALATWVENNQIRLVEKGYKRRASIYERIK